MGLAGRFGLTIVFEAPKRQDYLEIVRSMAKEKGIFMPSDELDRSAEAFALRGNGRSPRIARQFIDSILSCKDSSTSTSTFLGSSLTATVDRAGLETKYFAYT